MTPLDLLWSGWRSTYVTSGAERRAARNDAPGSVFTRILRSGLDDTATHIVHRGASTFAILNAFPYGVGHLLVLPYREVADLEDLAPDEVAELWPTVTDAVGAVKRGLSPDGVNVGLNLGRPAGGSVREHLHVHVVPRWTGDANFMTATANTRTIPQTLDDTATKVRAAWSQRNPSSSAEPASERTRG